MHIKKGIFGHIKKHHHDAKIMCTYAHYVAAKWPAQALKMKPIPGLRDPQGYSHISLSLSGRILKEYQNIVSAAELPGLAIRTGKYAIFLTSEDHVPVGLLYCDESTEVSRLVDFCFSLSCLIKLD